MLRVWVPRARLHGDVEPQFNERCLPLPRPCRCPRRLLPSKPAAFPLVWFLVWMLELPRASS